MPYDYTTAHRHQSAVLWRYGGTNDEGQVVVYDPIQLTVRWDETRQDVLNPLSGQMVTKVANVVVDQEIALGSILWLGLLADIGSASDFRQVIEYRETPNWNKTLIRRVVGLMRFGNSLPQSMSGTGTGG